MTTPSKIAQALETKVEKEEDEPTEPWRQVSFFDQIPKRPGYVRRAVRAQDVDKRIFEGWRVVRAAQGSGLAPLTLIDGTQLTDVMRIRNLIIMELPESRKKARQKYYRELTNESLGAEVKQLKDEVSSKQYEEAGAYGTISVKKGDVVIKKEA